MEIPVEYVIAGFVGMAAAITWLAKDQADSKRNAQANQRRCESEGAECRAKQAALDDFIRTTLLAHVAASGSRESATTAELARARHVIERAERRHPATSSEKKDQTPTEPHLTHA